jgi:tetratricopeptide (TPR) repeat protein
MHIDTTDNRALELLKEAQTSIALYQRSKERNRLEDARSTLEEALRKDEHYLRARFWRGLVTELLGETDEAVRELEQVKTAVADLELAAVDKPKGKKRGQENQHFLSMVQYNLGVAHFHQYSREQVDTAIATFADVIGQTANEELRLRARAWLAKAYSVRMIPKPSSENFDELTRFYESLEPKENAGKYFDLSRKESDAVIAAMTKRRDRSEAASEIKGVAYDARAVALMFHTDFYEEDRIKKLEQALEALETANEYRPQDWAIYCNFGSIHMRLGHWRQVESKKDSGPKADKVGWQSRVGFQKALGYLDEVVDRLRPQYGFALYEKGRTYRLMGAFAQAKECFDLALKIKRNRDVSDSRINFEKERARRKLTTFP